MKRKKINSSKLLPENQLDLYGFDSYFDKFNKLFSKKKLPKAILISGQKGIGKSVFVNHFISFF